MSDQVSINSLRNLQKHKKGCKEKMAGKERLDRKRGKININIIKL